MLSINALRQENNSLYKTLLSDRNIADGQRDVISTMLADEEAKLLNLFSPQGRLALAPE